MSFRDLFNHVNDATKDVNEERLHRCPKCDKFFNADENEKCPKCGDKEEVKEQRKYETKDGPKAHFKSLIAKQKAKKNKAQEELKKFQAAKDDDAIDRIKEEIKDIDDQIVRLEEKFVGRRIRKYSPKVYEQAKKLFEAAYPLSPNIMNFLVDHWSHFLSLRDAMKNVIDNYGVSEEDARQLVTAAQEEMGKLSFSQVPERRIRESQKRGVDYANFLGNLDGLLDTWEVTTENEARMKRRIRDAVRILDEKKQGMNRQELTQYADELADKIANTKNNAIASDLRHELDAVEIEIMRHDDKADDEKYRHENESKVNKNKYCACCDQDTKQVAGVCTQCKSTAAEQKAMEQQRQNERDKDKNESKVNEKKVPTCPNCGNQPSGAKDMPESDDFCIIGNKWHCGACGRSCKTPKYEIESEGRGEREGTWWGIEESKTHAGEECPECGSKNTISGSKDGDSFLRCKGCGYAVENNVEVRKSRKVKESKVNEEEGLMGGGSTRASDPSTAAPTPVAEEDPELKKEAPVAEEPKPEEEELPPEGEKEYLGNKGGEEYFYFVIVPSEDGTKDLQIQDANDEVVYSAKENQIDATNNEEFLWKGIQELQLSNIATEIIDKYLMPEEKPVDIEKEEGQAETGEEQTQDVETEEPKESGVIPELGAPAFKSHMGESKMNEKTPPGEEYVVKGIKKSKSAINPYAVSWAMRNKGARFRKGPHAGKKMASVGETTKADLMDRLLEKFGLNERNFETKEEFADFLMKSVIPELRVTGRDGIADQFEEAVEWLTRPESAVPTPPPPTPTSNSGKDRSKEKFYNIDMDKLYKTGDVGEAKLNKLIEKYGLVESMIDRLLEKYGLDGRIHEAMVNGRRIIEQGEELPKIPKNAEELDRAEVPAPGPDAAMPPEAGVEAPGPEGMNVSAESEPAPAGGEPKAEDMATPESAEANLRMQYPEEPYTTTAMAYADSVIDEPRVYGAIRNLKWTGAYANSETFLKQSKIVGNYNEFNPDIAKRLVDAVGEGAKFRLAREGSVAVYFTIRDTDKKISLETLKGIVRADEADPTGNPGEARLWWD